MKDSFVEQIQPRNVKDTGEGQNYLVGMKIPAHDYLALTEASTTDTWVYKIGGATGETVATIIITYTDSGKSTIANVTKS
jgi:hypothetical protein